MGHHEYPGDVGVRQLNGALCDAQWFVRKFTTVAEMHGLVIMIDGRPQPAVPQRTGREWHRTLPRDLPIKAAVWLKEALVAKWPVHADFAIGTNFGRSNHCGQDIFELIVEILFD